MKLIWSEPAEQDLEAAADYIATQNPRVAVQLVDKTLERVQILLEFPEMGRPGQVAGTREFLLSPYPYFVVYRVKDNLIEIVGFMHMSQDYP